MAQLEMDKSEAGEVTAAKEEEPGPPGEFSSDDKPKAQNGARNRRRASLVLAEVQSVAKNLGAASESADRTMAELEELMASLHRDKQPVAIPLGSHERNGYTQSDSDDEGHNYATRCSHNSENTESRNTESRNTESRSSKNSSLKAEADSDRATQCHSKSPKVAASVKSRFMDAPRRPIDAMMARRTSSFVARYSEGYELQGQLERPASMSLGQSLNPDNAIMRGSDEPLASHPMHATFKSLSSMRQSEGFPQGGSPLGPPPVPKSSKSFQRRSLVMFNLDENTEHRSSPFDSQDTEEGASPNDFPPKDIAAPTRSGLSFSSQGKRSMDRRVSIDRRGSSGSVLSSPMVPVLAPLSSGPHPSIGRAQSTSIISGAHSPTALSPTALSPTSNSQIHSQGVTRMQSFSQAHMLPPGMSATDIRRTPSYHSKPLTPTSPSPALILPSIKKNNSGKGFFAKLFS